MKKLLFTSVAVIALATALPAAAQISDSKDTDGEALIGGTAGAGVGAGVGFLVGGPIGAVVGGFAGAVLGAEASVPGETVSYAGANPVAVVYVDGTWDIGATVPETVVLYPVEPTPEYSYVYANNRVYIANTETREIVYSPGFAIPQSAVVYAEANPTTSIFLDGDVMAGAVLDGSVELAMIPDHPRYGYVYVDDRPAIVDVSSRMIVWVK